MGSLYSESQVICTPFQTAVKKIYSHNLFFLTIIESYTYKDMFSPCRKVLDFRFCPVYIIVTSGPSVLEWAWLSAKYCRGLWEVAIWFRERNSSFTFRKCPRIILFYFFYGDWWIAQRIFAVVTFCLFPSTRFVSNWESSRNDYN